MSEAFSESRYTKEEQRAALGEAFKSLYFKTATLRQITYMSYKINLSLMVEYAIRNNIDELEYIRSIRQVLLKDNSVYEYRH